MLKHHTSYCLAVDTSSIFFPFSMIEDVLDDVVIGFHNSEELLGKIYQFYFLFKKSFLLCITVPPCLLFKIINSSVSVNVATLHRNFLSQIFKHSLIISCLSSSPCSAYLSAAYE